MERRQIRTPAQVRDDFQRRGMSIGAWAKKHGASRQLVYAILKGDPRRQCKRGESHRIAVLLGIKDGLLDPFDPADAALRSANQ